MWVHLQLRSSFPENILVAELYKAIYEYIVKHENIAELTVEDPAEAFEDLRDKNDLKLLLSNQQFMAEGFGGQESHGGGRVSGIGRGGKSGRGGAKKEASASKGKLVPPVDKVWVEKWRKELKIAGVSTSAAMIALNSDQHKYTATVSEASRNAYTFASRSIRFHWSKSISPSRQRKIVQVQFCMCHLRVFSPILTYWAFRF